MEAGTALVGDLMYVRGLHLGLGCADQSYLRDGRDPSGDAWMLVPDDHACHTLS